jgi:hypothetical protein
MSSLVASSINTITPFDRPVQRIFVLILGVEQARASALVFLTPIGEPVEVIIAA